MVISQLGTRADPEHDQITVDGKPIKKPALRTLMLHKPIGVTTTVSDRHARHTVMALVPEIPGLHPVGRLDQDSSGLLLLTNDGNLTHALTHPRHLVEKTYHAQVAGIPDEDALEHIRRGVMLDDGLTAPARVQMLQRDDQSALVEITIHEGRNRQVRRMFARVKHPVLTLTRVRIGPLALGKLQEGAWRDLAPWEVQALFTAAEGSVPTRRDPSHAVDKPVPVPGAAGESRAPVARSVNSRAPSTRKADSNGTHQRKSPAPAPRTRRHTGT